MKDHISTQVRIIWAVALKDISDAIKNKTVLGIIVGIVFMMLSSQALPLIMKVNAKPRAFFYDPGQSLITKAITRNHEIDFFPVETKEELLKVVGSSSVPILGVAIPSAFDELAEEDQTIILQGYTIHWAKPSEITPLVDYYEKNLSKMTDQEIRIQMYDEGTYPDQHYLGFTQMIIHGLVLGVMLIGLILVPLLVIEERESRTLDALLISPAKTYHLLAGKSLAGIFYCLLAALFMFLFTGRWIVHWHIAILAVLLGALSAAAVGLLLGSIFENPTTLNMWVGLVIVLFILPVYLWISAISRLTPIIVKIFQLLPTVAMSKLIIFSLTKPIKYMDVLNNSLVMVGFSIIMVLLVSWRINQIGRVNSRQ